MSLVTQDEVKKLLQKLKTDKAQGQDEMHPYFQRNGRRTSLAIRYYIHKVSGIITSTKEWEKRRITALFKKGSKRLASNYCPVSLTSIVCKCMKKIVRDSIFQYMKKNNLFSEK